MSYPEHLLGRGLTSLLRCSWYILQPQPTGHGCIVSFPICGSFKHNVGTEEIGKQITWKCIWCRYQDKTNYYYYIWNHKGCFAQRFYIWYWYRRSWYCYSCTIPQYSITSVTMPNILSQAIVSHLVLWQDSGAVPTILLQLLLCARLYLHILFKRKKKI